MLRLRSLGFLAAVSAVILAAYLAYPLVEGIRTPIGPDGPLYVWWSRLAETRGLGVAPGRAGAPGLVLLLGTFLRTEPLQTVAILGPALAVVTGLAVAGLLETALGPSPARAAWGALLGGAWAAYLGPSWLAGLLLVPVFLASAAAFAGADTSRRAAVAGGVLLGAAGLAHLYMFPLALVVLAGPLALLVLRARREGEPASGVWAARMAMGMAGSVVAVGVSAVALPSRAVPGDTSQDAFLRRTGMLDLLRAHFRARMVGDGRRALIPAVPGAALWAAGRRAWDGTPRARWLAALCATWAGLTAAGLVALAIHPRAQGNRLVAFGFFVPVAAAVGGAVWWGRGGWRRAAAVTLGAAMAAGAMFGWYRQDPHIHPHEVRAVARLDTALQGLPSSSPVTVLVDTDEVDAALHVVRYLNVIRAVIDPDRIPQVRVAVGRPDAGLGGRPTFTGDREHDRLARETAATAARAGIVFVLRPFTPWYEEARTLGREIAPGVVVIGSEDARPSAPPVAPSAGLGPAGLILGCLGALLLLVTAGAGWSAWAFGTGRASLALAPSVGAGVLVLTAVVADGVGLRLADPIGAILAGAIAASGYALWAHRLR